jgi:hypothetical protein
MSGVIVWVCPRCKTAYTTYPWWCVVCPRHARATSKPGGSILPNTAQPPAVALGRPRQDRYRVASGSPLGGYYDLTAGGDVTCTCPGFESRGMCRHASELKAALAAGGPLPPGYTPG